MKVIRRKGCRGRAIYFVPHPWELLIQDHLENLNKIGLMVQKVVKVGEVRREEEGWGKKFLCTS